MTIKSLQTRAIQNKLNHGFITKKELKNPSRQIILNNFLSLHGEVSEAVDAYKKQKDDLGHELADCAIYLLSIAELLGFNLEEQILQKMAINEKRKYVKVNGHFVKQEDLKQQTV